MPASFHPPKEGRLVYQSRTPPRIWDNLKEVPLVHNALVELDRRNYEVAQDLAGETSPSTTTTPISEYLKELTPARLNQIKAFARNGGPDSTNLRGVFHYHTAVMVANWLQYTAMNQRSQDLRSLGQRKRGISSDSKSKPKIMPASSKRTKNTSPYDRAFQQHFIDHQVFSDDYQDPDGGWAPPPDNLKEILAVLAKPQPSLSPSQFTDRDFVQFRRANAQISKEWQIA
jgi:hypothetical protein